MREFRSRGCQFSLDDFGSGLSSFMYLKNLPVDYLKIDGQFIQNVTTDHVDRSMVEAITQIGRAMGIKTVAERVETPKVLACLADIGVEYAQGIFIAVPQSVESLSRITRTHPKLKLVHSAERAEAGVLRPSSIMVLLAPDALGSLRACLPVASSRAALKHLARSNRSHRCAHTMEREHIPGRYAVVALQDDRERPRAGWGYADVAAARPMTPDAVQLDLIRSPRTSPRAAVLALAEKGGSM
jgi:hypothetical protein